MKTWFTADTHFGHVNMTREGKDLCNRGFDTVDEMNKALLEGINSTVSSSDRLVILGDLVMGKLEVNIHLLADIQAAEVVLVPGNHDRWSRAYHHKGDAEAKREEWRLRYEATRTGIVALADVDIPHAAHPFINLAWYEKGHPLEDCIFSHYPYEGDSHDEDRYADLRPLDVGEPLVHGHVHDSWRINGRQFNVGVDVNDFKPVSEEELADWVRSL